MKEWFGSSGLCINDNGQLLMVLQGKIEEKKLWSIPSGGKEVDESFEQCCIREMEEETGYLTEIVEEVKVKRIIYDTHNIAAEVRYYIVRIVGGERNIRDPDGLIYDIAWKGLKELKTLKLTYPEDRDFLIQYIRRDSSNHTYIGDYK